MGRFNRFFPHKILLHSDRLARIAEGEYPYPVDWHIYPTNVCNHSCHWCMFRQPMVSLLDSVPADAYADRTALAAFGEQAVNRERLSEPLLMRAVEEARSHDAQLVHFSGGGEPLVNPHTLEAMRRASDLGLAVALSTNGVLLVDEVASVVDFIRVSLNAGTPEHHYRSNHVDGEQASWGKILANVKRAVASKRGDLGLAFVIDEFNYTGIPAFCAIAADLGVDFCHIRPAFYFDAQSDAKIRALMPRALELCELARERYGDDIEIHALTSAFDGFWTPRTYDRCRAVLTGVCLTASGDFAVCQDRTDLRFGAAFRDGASFAEVWGSPEHRALVESIVAPGALERCPRCVWNTRNQIIDEVFVKDTVRVRMI